MTEQDIERLKAEVADRKRIVDPWEMLAAQLKTWEFRLARFRQAKENDWDVAMGATFFRAYGDEKGTLTYDFPSNELLEAVGHDLFSWAHIETTIELMEGHVTTLRDRMDALQPPS